VVVLQEAQDIVGCSCISSIQENFAKAGPKVGYQLLRFVGRVSQRKGKGQVQRLTNLLEEHKTGRKAICFASASCFSSDTVMILLHNRLICIHDYSLQIVQKVNKRYARAALREWNEA
jgi:hypothetical protein